MLVEGQLVEVKVGSHTVKHYNGLGYNVHNGDIIHVPPEHLTKGSHAIVQVICDYCGGLIKKPYKDYLFQHALNIDACSNCYPLKVRESCMVKYGVDNVFQLDEIKNKIMQTLLEKYGVKYTHQNKDIRAKWQLSCAKNGDIRTSSQQLQLLEMIKQRYPNAILNYPYSDCSLDIYICVDDMCIDIEYDGWFWHKDKQKDIRRDRYLQSQGFKVLRIRSGRLLPDENELLSAIDSLINTEYRFKEIILPDWDKNMTQEVIE